MAAMAAAATGGGADMMPDLSHLSAEERAIIEQVLQRQRAEEQKEEEIAQRADKELDEIERQIAERKENALRLVGTQDDAICQICQKTKFADGIGHKCFYCQLRSCARCGGKTTSKNKNIWACSLCQKRQQILARTGKWFQTGNADTAPGSGGTNTDSGPGADQMAPADETDQRRASSDASQLSTAATAVVVTDAQLQRQISLKRQNTLQRQGSVEARQHTADETVAAVSTSSPRPTANGSLPKGATLPAQQQPINNGGSGAPQPPPHHPQSARRSSASRQKPQQQPNHSPQQAPPPQDNYYRGEAMTSHDPSTSSDNYHYPNQQPRPPSHQKDGARRISHTVTQHVQQNQQQQQQQLTPYPQERQQQHRQGRNYQEERGRRCETLSPSAVVPPAVPPANLSSSGGVFAATTSSVLNDGLPPPLQQNGGSGGGIGLRRSKLPRQLHSLSSSDEELHAAQQSAHHHHQSSASGGGGSSGRRSTHHHRSPHHNHQLTVSQQQLQQQQQQCLPSSASLQNTTATLQDADFSEKASLSHFDANSLRTAAAEAAASEIPSASARGVSSGGSNAVRNTGKMLATKIRNYLSHPISWQPSADQRRLIGHMILTRPSSSSMKNGSSLVANTCGSSATDDFGLKVVGGRYWPGGGGGGLRTFIVKVKPGSVADTIGQLRPGDEVLEWNAHRMRNLSHDAVCRIVGASRDAPRLELIVSRAANVPGNDDFLNVQRMLQSHNSGGPAVGPPFLTADCRTGSVAPFPSALPQRLLYDATGRGGIPHSQSLVGTTSLNGRPLGQLYDPSGVAQPLSQMPLFHHHQQWPPAFGASGQRAASPLVFHRTFNAVYDDASALAAVQMPSATQICGKIELSLLYLSQKRELVVTLMGAYDLVPRRDGTLRNPYVKFFLLPDRSEKSRRQSATLADTLTPFWNESFYYYELTEPMLTTRVLEVTVWDYDKYEANAFLGEALIDLSQTLLDNQPFTYVLVDMDEDNPIRMRLRQRRYSSQTPPMRQRAATAAARTIPVAASAFRSGRAHLVRRAIGDFEDAEVSGGGMDYSASLQNLMYYPNPDVDPMRSSVVDTSVANDASQSRRRWRARRAESMNDGGSNNASMDYYGGGNGEYYYGNTDDPTTAQYYGGYPAADWNRNQRSGYLSDYGNNAEGGSAAPPLSSLRNNGGGIDYRHLYRRPRSATALRNVNEFEDYGYVADDCGGYPPTDALFYPYDEDAQKQQYDPKVNNNNNNNNNCTVNQRQAAVQPQRRPHRREREILQQETAGSGGGGYGSDASDGTLSVNSAQSMQNRARAQQQQQQQFQYQQQQIQQQSYEYGNNGGMPDESLNGSGGGVAQQLQQQQQPPQSAQTQQTVTGLPHGKSATVLLSKRKKSLMTRFIPGRNGSSDANKRMGFARSEEVGVPEPPPPTFTAGAGTPTSSAAVTSSGGGLATGGIVPAAATIMKQTSKESTDSSENWLPIMADKPLGSFVENLGPGQVVGRQSLGSAVLGEIQLGIAYDSAQGGILLDVQRAKNLVVRPGKKSNPAPYVKAYLMEGKNVIAKAKTQAARKTTAPLIQQRLIFGENPRGKMLQVSVLGDYGRMERKAFMGVVQINLDELDLSGQPPGTAVSGWYKLFHSNSLAGGATTAVSVQPAGQLSQYGGIMRKDSEISMN